MKVIGFRFAVFGESQRRIKSKGNLAVTENRKAPLISEQ